MSDEIKALVERAKREIQIFGECGAKSCDAMIAALTAQADEIERLRAEKEHLLQRKIAALKAAQEVKA